jgi:hypothetical protein
MDAGKESTRRVRRQAKREVKCARSQRPHRILNQALRDNPEGARPSEFDFDRPRSALMNGMDNAPTRRRIRPLQDEA